MVESEGIAPSSTCLRGRCITCLPRPRENGRPPRCCPERTEFWRLGRASWRAAYGRLVRLPEIAPGHSPWRGGILAVKSQPLKLKGPEASLLPAHAISTKNKHLLVSSRCQPAVSRRIFRCLEAHLPTSPSNVKCSSVASLPRRLLAAPGHTESVGGLIQPFPFSIWRSVTSSRCRACFSHSRFAFTFAINLSPFGQQKTLLTSREQGWENPFGQFVTCSRPADPNLSRADASHRPWIGSRGAHNLDSDG
jgi:hypothetical protein